MKQLAIAFLAVALFSVVAAESNDCPRACPLIYGPVCGSDAAGNKETFDNMCMYNLHNCRQRKNGLPELTTVTTGRCI
ncbi:hypothetical protein J437_LFUL014839 [Ladona fulva]|uniref:Kazal-like domain-containing protein n=1 Tax=Ladona fulva TaxID=123851 RepID=A0A8K0KHK0_LADFU|nr:hypothetical protein J437_LFUL014839 [Ladona fulva]